MIPIKYFLYQCSAYFTVLLSLERYLSVCKQHSVPFKRIKIYIGLIVLFSFLYNFPICFERWYEWDKDNKEYKIFYTRLRKKNELIGKLYTQVYETYMYNIFFIALPLVCLIVFNILIVRKVCMTQLSRRITWIKKIFRTWDLYYSILYTLVYYFLKKTKFFNPGFFFY